MKKMGHRARFTCSRGECEPIIHLSRSSRDRHSATRLTHAASNFRGKPFTSYDNLSRAFWIKYRGLDRARVCWTPCVRMCAWLCEIKFFKTRPAHKSRMRAIFQIAGSLRARRVFNNETNESAIYRRKETLGLLIAIFDFSPRILHRFGEPR